MAIVAPDVASGAGGGTGMISEALVREFSARDHVVATLIANYDGGSALRRLFMGLSAAWRIIRNRDEIRVVHLQVTTGLSIERDLLAAVVARALRMSVVVQFHGAGQRDDYVSGSALHRFFYRALIQLSNEILLLGTNAERWIHAIAPRARTAIIPNFAEPVRDHAAPPDEPPTILFVGRLGRRKGIYDLLSALQLLDAEGCCPAVSLAGDGDLNAVRSAVDRSPVLRDSVRILGWQGPDEIAELMLASTAVVLPSYAEGLPIAILEAMAHGRAVIATRVGEVGDAVVDGENGILISPGDVPGLAKAIRDVVSDSEYAAELGRAGLARVEAQFAPEKVIESLTSVYRAVASEKRGRTAARLGQR